MDLHELGTVFGVAWGSEHFMRDLVALFYRPPWGPVSPTPPTLPDSVANVEHDSTGEDTSDEL
jgi:hypothetical protein